jgi:TonB family protein
MSLKAYIDDTPGIGDVMAQRKPRSAMAVSLCLHVAAAILLLNTPELKLPEPATSEYQQAFEGKEDKLVWFRFNKELPDVTPPANKAERKPVRAEVKAPQEMVASRKDAPERKQIVWTDAPALKDMPPVELPNVIAVRLPRMAREFAPPRETPRTEVRSPEIPNDAPQLTAPLDPVKIADAPKIARPFTVPPPTHVPVKIAEVAPAPEAPQLESRADAPALSYAFKAPARPFAAPPVKTLSAPAKQRDVEAPPSIGGAGSSSIESELLAANSRDLNLAAVGLNPAAKGSDLPSNSSPGQFSAGPKVRLEGADSSGDGKGVNVPDLYVRGGKDAKPDLIAQAFAAPTSATNLRAAGRLSPPRIVDEPSAPAENLPGVVKVANAPDRRFDGRDVYMMAIQMPNLTSYSGSWLMWYSDRTARAAGLAPVAPPIAHRKVDPKYIASAAADRVEGKIQLACVINREGHVSTVELVRGLDDRLNRSAEEALAKWEFTPATREGVPIDVDVLVEIPFRLAPKAQVPY